MGQLPEDARGSAKARVRSLVAQALQLTIGEQLLASGRAGPPPRIHGHHESRKAGWQRAAHVQQPSPAPIGATENLNVPPQDAPEEHAEDRKLGHKRRRGRRRRKQRSEGEMSGTSPEGGNDGTNGKDAAVCEGKHTEGLEEAPTQPAYHSAIPPSGPADHAEPELVTPARGSELGQGPPHIVRRTETEGVIAPDESSMASSGISSIAPRTCSPTKLEPKFDKALPEPMAVLVEPPFGGDGGGQRGGSAVSVLPST